MLSDRLWNQIKKPWENLVVVKLLRRPIGCTMLKNHIKDLWQLIGYFKVIDLDNSFFPIQLALGRPCEGHAWRPLDNHRTLPYNSAMNLRFSCCYS